MKPIKQLFETYIYALVHPYRMHDYHLYGIPPYADSRDLPKITLAESMAISWVMVAIKGIFRLLMANMMVKLFLSFQADNPFFSFIDSNSGLIPYYIILFSTALDVIFYPVVAFISVEFWNLILGFYAQLLGVTEESRARVERVSVLAMSSHLFLIIPILGQVLSSLSHLFLMYVGIRKNLNASRSLTLIILATPYVIGVMILSLMALGIFCLISL